MIKHKASDLHLKPDAPPTVRLNGDLIPVGDHILSEAQCRSLVFAAIPMIKRKLLIRRREVDHAYVSAGVRFRLNAFLERGRVSAAFRMVNSVIPAFRELNLPPILEKLAMMNNGLVLVTGPAGSGKSTTLASVIDFINRNRKVHVVTIEDPIEFHHRDQNSFVTQREVGSDTQSFPEALRQALRQDPNVIMLGEMRDAETIMTAVTAAETGHLVLSTLHTPNAVQAIDRIVDAFQGESQQQVRLLLSTCLRAVISQKLLNRIDGRGRVPATEVMVCTATIASHILDGETHNIYQYVASGASEGMQTYTQSLARLVQRGLISKEEAMYHADRPTEFRLQAEGHTSSTVPSDSESSGSYVSYL
ncbi:MAG: PilT/PilU family type 4a pilus ATPase [Armatimonadetes bacterium]|nr:PilT/PilU family type 4a pilus ATPase [Armatimonadota bacterium]